MLDGTQYLVRYLSLNPEDFLKCCGLLTTDEQDALLAIINGDSDSSNLPDHLLGMTAIMRTKRKGRMPTVGPSKRGFGSGKSALRLKRSKNREKERADKAAAAAAAQAAAEKDRRRVQELKLKERNKEKFNIIEEFFICLACIFD